MNSVPKTEKKYNAVSYEHLSDPICAKTASTEAALSFAFLAPIATQRTQRAIQNVYLKNGLATCSELWDSSGGLPSRPAKRTTGTVRINSTQGFGEDILID
jgi:hypothetical protein